MNTPIRLAARGLVGFIALAMYACGGGGGDAPSGGPPPPPPAAVPPPQNVAATASYRRVELTWSAVANASGYRVYAANTAGAPIAGLTPIEITAPPYVESGAANWVRRYYRVTARIATREGAPSVEVDALPTGGWIVAERAGVGIRRYHADEPEVVIDSIADAVFDRDAAGQPMKVGDFGVAYGIQEILGTTEYQELGLFLSSVPVEIGAEAGHRYRLVGMIESTPPRVLFRDYDGVTYSLRSAQLDGSDARILVSDCLFLRVPSDSGFHPILAASGLVFHCRKSRDGIEPSSDGWWHSDGVATAVRLPYPSLANDPREPKALFADRVIMNDPAISYLTTQLLNGVDVETRLFEPYDVNVTHALEVDAVTGKVAVGPGGQVVVRRFKGGGLNQARFVRVNYDGTAPDSYGDNVGVFGKTVVFRNVSPDGTKFVGLVVNTPPILRDYAYVFSFDQAAPVKIDLDVPNPTSDDARFVTFLKNGKILVNRCGTNQNCGDAEAGNYIALADGTFEDPVTKLLDVARSPDYFPIAFSANHVIMQDPNTRELDAIDSVAHSTVPLCKLNVPVAGVDCNSRSPNATARADGYITFVDDVGNAWLARMPGLSPPVRIDGGVPTERVIHVGDGPENILYFAMRRKADNGDVESDIIAVDLDTVTVTTLVGGPTDDFGFFFAN